MRKLTYKIVEETTNSQSQSLLSLLQIELLNGLRNNI